MEIAELSRNKKVALARWNTKITNERSKILQTNEGRILKAMICGFLAGDGSVQMRKEKSFYHYQLDFFPDDKLMMKKYIYAINKVYKKNPCIKIKNKFFCVRKTSKTIVTDLLKIAKFDTKNWSLPHSLLTCNKSKAAWLNAFFSAEAYVNSKVIRVQTVNKNGMNKISELLEYFQIKHKRYEYQPKKDNHSKVHIISINQKSERKKYYEEIGFWHEKKTMALKAALNL